MEKLYPETASVMPGTPVKVIGYLAGDRRKAPILAGIEEQVSALESLGLDAGQAQVAAGLVKEADWAENWKKFYHPPPGRRRIVIKPRWKHMEAQLGDNSLGTRSRAWPLVQGNTRQPVCA